MSCFYVILIIALSTQNLWDRLIEITLCKGMNNFFFETQILRDTIYTYKYSAMIYAKNRIFCILVAEYEC